MNSFREYLRKGVFKALSKHEHTTTEGWFDMEEFTTTGNYFLLKQGRICRSKRKSWQQ